MTKSDKVERKIGMVLSYHGSTSLKLCATSRQDSVPDAVSTERILIQAVQFTMAKHNTSGPCVNIRKYDVLPPTAEIKAGRYFYKTDHLEPDEFPMHPKIFMHCWYHHHDYTEQGLAVEGLPNKLHHPMQYEAVLSPPGWGIYIVENFDSGLVACIVTGASLIITLFVALWSSLMNDTQGGTGIGQYMLALIGSVILAVGGYLSTVWSMES